MPSPASTATPDELRRALARWLPAPLRGQYVDFDEPLIPLAPAEEAVVRQAVAKRHREFQAGRHCAKAALRDFGLTDTVLPAEPDRQPCWPPGFVGSISHTGSLDRGCALAVVGRAAEVRGIGVDIETGPILSPDLWRHVLTPNEQRELGTLPPDGRAHRALVVFSAKEALYKAQYPATGRRLGFADVEVQVQGSGAFAVHVHDEVAREWLERHEVRGRFVDWRLAVVTLVTIRECA